MIDAPAKDLLDEHIKWLDKNAKKICRLEPPKEAANGCFVPPAFYEIQSLSQLNRENFGAILHVIRFAGDKPECLSPATLFVASASRGLAGDCLDARFRNQ